MQFAFIIQIWCLILSDVMRYRTTAVRTRTYNCELWAISKLVEETMKPAEKDNLIAVRRSLIGTCSSTQTRTKQKKAKNHKLRVGVTSPNTIFGAHSTTSNDPTSTDPAYDLKANINIILIILARREKSRIPCAAPARPKRILKIQIDCDFSIFFFSLPLSKQIKTMSSLQTHRQCRRDCCCCQSRSYLMQHNLIMAYKLSRNS